MSKMNTCKSKNTLSKQIIIDKALELMEKKEYNKVSIEKICTELNVTKGAFYHYFKSKSDIVFYQYKLNEGKLLEYYNTILHFPADKQLRLIFDYYNNFFIKERFQETKIMIKLEVENNLKNFGSKNSLQVKIIGNIIEHGIHQGCFKNTIDANKMAIFFITHLSGILYQWCLYNAKYEFKEKLDFFYENFFLVALLP